MNRNVEDGDQSLRIGWIPYWNLHPLRREFNKAMHRRGHDLQFLGGHPSSVNRWLSEGRVTLAPCSSICLLTQASHEVALPLGVASNGPVLSVYLALHGPDDACDELLAALRLRQSSLREAFAHRRIRYDDDARMVAKSIWSDRELRPACATTDIPSLRLTPASQASASLARLLYGLWFGSEAQRRIIIDAEQPDFERRVGMELLIGDEALEQRARHSHIIDLGAAWQQMTGLPFVFAVWQCVKGRAGPRDDFFRRALWQASALAEATMSVDPSRYLPDVAPLDVRGDPLDLGAYWKCIEYRLSAGHWKGLFLYLCLSRLLLGMQNDTDDLGRILRWQEAADNTASLGL